MPPMSASATSFLCRRALPAAERVPVDATPPIGVLFVCLGNICRSPAAEGVFRHRLASSPFADRVHADSAGTGDWHVGEPPHRGSIDATRRRGIDIGRLRGRQVDVKDFERFTMILAMDRSNLDDLRSLRPQGFQGHLGLFLDFAPNQPVREMPDPYGRVGSEFDRMLDLVEQGVDGLIDHLGGRLATPK